MVYIKLLQSIVSICCKSSSLDAFRRQIIHWQLIIPSTTAVIHLGRDGVHLAIVQTMCKEKFSREQKLAGKLLKQWTHCLYALSKLNLHRIKEFLVRFNKACN